MLVACAKTPPGYSSGLTKLLKLSVNSVPEMSTDSRITPSAILAVPWANQPRRAGGPRGADRLGDRRRGQEEADPLDPPVGGDLIPGAEAAALAQAGVVIAAPEHDAEVRIAEPPGAEQRRRRRAVLRPPQ